jgi:hypothetical protein
LFQKSPKPLNLCAANQKRIEGGKQIIPLTFHFQNPHLGTKVTLKGLFYEAEIPVDIIWSYGWMAENKIIPLPEFSQLGVRENNDIFVLEPICRKKRTSAAGYEIDTTPMKLVQNSKQPEKDEDWESCLAISSSVGKTTKMLSDGKETWFPHSKAVQHFHITGEVGQSDIPLSQDENVYVSHILESYTPETSQVFGLVQTDNLVEHPLAVELGKKYTTDIRTRCFGKIYIPITNPVVPRVQQI